METEMCKRFPLILVLALLMAAGTLGFYRAGFFTHKLAPAIATAESEPGIHTAQAIVAAEGNRAMAASGAKADKSAVPALTTDQIAGTSDETAREEAMKRQEAAANLEKTKTEVADAVKGLEDALAQADQKQLADFKSAVANLQQIEKEYITARTNAKTPATAEQLRQIADRYVQAVLAATERNNVLNQNTVGSTSGKVYTEDSRLDFALLRLDVIRATLNLPYLAHADNPMLDPVRDWENSITSYWTAFAPVSVDSRRVLDDKRRAGETVTDDITHKERLKGAVKHLEYLVVFSK
jgi:hypothetical protein